MSASMFPHLTPIDLSHADRSNLLDSTSWSGEFAWRELEAIGGYTEGYKARPGIVVVKEGSREAFMGIVIDGQLNVLKADADGNDKVLGAIRTGKTFGEMALVDGEPRSATLVTAGEATLLILTRNSLDRMCDEQPRVALKFMFKLSRLISQRLRQTSGSLADKLRD